jgi:AcrR family transcriptional regulator
MTADAGGTADPTNEGRSARKRRVILEAATELFLKNGYAGTSMDEIASVAGVSKQTVYKHFADKEGLFQEIVLGTIDQVGEPFYDAVPSLGETVEVEADLRALARGLVAIVMRPQLLQLRRLVIAEAGRFPELGRTYYERGPGRTAKALASHFEQLAARGLLTVEDPALIASHFLWLVVSIPLNAVMFGGSETQFTTRQLHRFADTGARAFLEGYRRR